MDTVLQNIAAVATMQLSMNSAMSVSTPNLNVNFTRANAYSLSSSNNATNFTDESTLSIPDLCSLLGTSLDCENTPIVKQVTRNKLELMNQIKYLVKSF
jgi:hypothetical protein